MTNKTDEYGYNLRERMNLYVGTALGAIAPVVGLKYLISLDNNSLGDEVACWLVSLAINFSPLLVKQPPLPLYGSAVGAAFGMIGANNLRQRREEREEKYHLQNNLEKVIDVNFKEIN
ncbi:MAG: hypothetical protein WC867_08415 [Candidatus Pacearchaeota archaeon]|jgi:hypothetical protein